MKGLAEAEALRVQGEDFKARETKYREREKREVEGLVMGSDGRIWRRVSAAETKVRPSDRG